MARKREASASAGSTEGLARTVLDSMRREAQRRRRRSGLRAALWGQFHQWVQDDTVQAVVIHGSRALHILQAGIWRRLPTPFRRDQQVRELLRRLTLGSRRERGPLHGQLPEGFELFSWEDGTCGETVVLLRRMDPVRPTVAQLKSMLGGDAESLELLARELGRREPVLVCGPGQHARERVLVALTALLAAERRVVWLVDRRRPVPVSGAAAVVAVDCQRLHTEPNLAREIVEQLMAFAPDWLVVQDAPSSLLSAVDPWAGPGGLGFLAGAAFPLRRGAAGRGPRVTARSTQDLPEKFRWIVEVAGYRRPAVEGIWRALPRKGRERWWQRLPINGGGSQAVRAFLAAASEWGVLTETVASRAAEEPPPVYAEGAQRDAQA